MMTDQHAAQPSLPTITGTGLLEQSTAASTLAMLKALPTSLTDEQFNQVKAIAKAPLPSLPGVGDEGFGKAMKLLETSLKRRKDDAEGDGELKFRAYRKCLSHLSHPQLWWAVEQAMIRLTFFPTIKELLDIAAGWERRDEATEAHRLAKLLMNREVNRRLKYQARKPVPPMTQEMIDTMDPELRKLGLKLGYLIEQDGKVIAAPESEGVEQ
jgi:hypothetical protein